jgi:hypothetical protein
MSHPYIRRIHNAEVFADYGHLTDGNGEVVRCTAAQADYVRKLLAYNMFVTATLDGKGNVVKVS